MRDGGGGGGVITGRSWRRSRGGSARVRRGGMYRRSSGRGRPCGSGIAAGQADGTYLVIFDHVLARQDAAGKLDWLVPADSTIVRAHQHAAGAPAAGRTGGKIE